MTKLTKRTVDAIRPKPGRDVFVWDTGDGAIKGFGVRTKPSGVAAYLVQYHRSGKRSISVTLLCAAGETPEAILNRKQEVNVVKR